MDKVFMYGAPWNPEARTYLEETFASSPSRIQFLFHFRLTNGLDGTFDGARFGINAAGYILELSFNQEEQEKIAPIISALQEWEKFKKYQNRFIFQTYDSELKSISIFFDCGKSDTIEDFERRFKDQAPVVIFRAS